MPQRANPLSLDVLGELSWEQFDEDFKDLTTKIQLDDESRQSWVQECADIDKQLRGKEERTRKPWPHATDISIPLTKKLLRRWTPVIYNLIAYANPVCHFDAGIPDAVMKAPTVEQFFDWLLKRYMDGALTEIRYLIHDIGSKGVGYLGASWDYRTEQESRVVIVKNIWPQGPPQDIGQVVRALVDQYEIRALMPEIQQHLVQVAQQIIQGAEYVRISFRRVVADKPKIVRHHPYDVIVPPDSGETHEADYVCLVHYYTPAQLRRMASDGLLNAEAVETALAESTRKDTGSKPAYTTVEDRYADSVRREEQFDAGVSKTSTQELIRVHQVYCMLDKNGDGINERCVLWYAATQSPVRLALFDFPFSFRHWPVFRFPYEDVDRRPYMSQGMGHQLKDIQTHYTQQFRATDDAIDIQLAPVFKRRVTSKFQPRTTKFGPGAVFDVQHPDDLLPLEKSPFNLHQYLQNRAEMKSFAEEMVGTIDSALAATGRSLERRTAFEVQQVAGQIEAVQGMDAAIFQSVMAKVFQCIWEMWLDFGPAEVYWAVTGDQEPKPFRKAEYHYRYQLTPAGTPGNTNRTAELQRALQVGQIMGQTAPQVFNWNAWAEWIGRLIDPRMARVLILTPEMQQQNQLVQQLAAQVAAGELPESVQMLAQSGSGAGGGS